ncbi:MAG TPA: glucose-6-phosphate isomerase [Chloroflexia bacterium]|nr:glucose-6-phosphate isomerase [Chloroflexia bacterium]
MSIEVLASLGNLQDAVDTVAAELEEEDFARRLWKKDTSLWKVDEASRETLSKQLGWLDLPQAAQVRAADLVTLAQDIKFENYQHIVLVGVGGNTLGPEIMRQVLGQIQGTPRLTVVDLTDPGFILQIEKAIDPASTLFVVSSKKGISVATEAFLAYFYDKVKTLKPEAAEANFVAVTDSGSSLEKKARELNFREVFLSPPDISGRYSVLSNYGLVPAVLSGYDIHQMISRAVSMAEECHKVGLENPGLHLGAVIGTAARQGRDKVTLVMPREISVFGLWVEQLIAENTGSEGHSILPVAGEELLAPEAYGSDRLFVYFQLENQSNTRIEERLKKLEAAGHPLVRLRLSNTYDLAAEFFRWEFAIAVAGAVLGVNPFEEPDITRIKDKTAVLLAEYAQSGQLPQLNIQPDPDGLRHTGRPGESAKEALEQLFEQVKPGDYVAFQAYTTPGEVNNAVLHELRTLVQEKLRVATTVGYGPRFLHSTGQLHKGGVNNGVLIQIVTADPEDVMVPGKPYSFSLIKQAQAIEDYKSLEARGRRVLSIWPERNGNDLGLERFKVALLAALP